MFDTYISALSEKSAAELEGEKKFISSVLTEKCSDTEFVNAVQSITDKKQPEGGFFKKLFKK